MADTFNYRIDHHGSLVRPVGLSTDDPDSVTQAVRETVAYQRKLRSTVVTDGDFPARTSAARSSTESRDSAARTRRIPTAWCAG